MYSASNSSGISTVKFCPLSSIFPHNFRSFPNPSRPFKFKISKTAVPLLVSSPEKMVSYEEIRRKRVEENQKRMEALKLQHLSLGLRPAPLKPTPRKPTLSRELAPQVIVLRRSHRVAKKPTPVYSEAVLERAFIPRRISKTRRDLSNRVYASEEGRQKATEKAEKLELSLGTDFPTFVKSMLQSHVTGGFWLGLNRHFCVRNLPKKDEVITLIDEDGDEYPTIYLPRKTGLSGGWKGFAVAHELVDGDALVFQLIRRTAFKVYIIRVKEFEGKNSNESS